MGDKQWLQCTIPLTEWESINARRAKSNLKWADLILPAVKVELDRLEADAAEAQVPAPAVKGRGKKQTTDQTANAAFPPVNQALTVRDKTLKGKGKQAPAPTDAVLKELAELREVK